MAANPAGSYLALTSPSTVSLGGARGGGVAQPSTTLDVVTARQGALAASLAAGSVLAASLDKIFGGAKLFGTVDLWRILGDIPAPGPATVGLADLAERAFEALLADPGRLVPIPVLRSRRIVRADGSPAVEARFVWKPVLRTDPNLKPLIDVGGARLVLDSRTVTPLDGGEPEATVRGELSGFSLSFAGVVRVRFGRLVFIARPGRKPDVSAEGVSVDFLGPLEFVNTIRDVLPDNGFSDPPAISVTPEGIIGRVQPGDPLGRRRRLLAAEPCPLGDAVPAVRGQARRAAVLGGGQAADHRGFGWVERQPATAVEDRAGHPRRRDLEQPRHRPVS